jgi:beta-phosphoglucomutase-like phosphatase (HAD superfamily)
MIVDFSNISYLISDWDGMIVNSMPAKTEAFTKVISEKFPIDPAMLRKFYNDTAGMPLSSQIKESVRRFANVEIEDPISFEEKFYKNLENIKFEIFPGAKDFLISVKQKGITLIIWSATTNEILKEQISSLGLSSYVDYFIANTQGNEILVKGPPLFKKIAKKFKISEEKLAKESLIIGDGKADVIAGKKVGAKTAVFRLKGTNADFYFETYVELLSNLPKLID